MKYRQILSEWEENGLRRHLRIIEGPQEAVIRLQGRELINFCSNNYLGLASDPRLVGAAQEAADHYGWGSGSAALISGQMDPHEALNEALRKFFGSPTLLFNSGYHANTGAIPALVDKNDIIFSDSLNHASIIDGCRLARCSVQVYPHGDVNGLKTLLQESPKTGRRWIVTESVFSMDGDKAPLSELAELAAQYDASLYIDEAHAVGVFGDKGQGLWEEIGAKSKDIPPLVRMGTLGKAFGSYGAFIIASHDICEYLLNKARTFVFTTALPPAVAAASAQAVSIVSSEPERREQLWNNVRSLAEQLGIEAQSPIIPWPIHGNEAVMAATEQLLEQGFYVQGIRAPTVAPGTERLRITVSAQHTAKQIRALATAIRSL